MSSGRGLSASTSRTASVARNREHRWIATRRFSKRQRQSGESGGYDSHQTPIATVATVMGTPTFAYSQNPTITPRRLAPSTTIRFAIDPTMVRLPASVLAIASASHARRGSGSAGTKRVNSITAGTLLTALERTAAAALRPATV